VSAALKQRARIARVRRLQHNMAASSAAAAAGQLRNLEVSRERLARMRGELDPAQGTTSGAWLSAASELATRLDAARQGLSGSIDAARKLAAAREQARLHARKSQESAEKLEQAAARAAAEATENRMNKSGARRRGKGAAET
jgi:predicted LPLAT superfamily acyltransferase